MAPKRNTSKPQTTKAPAESKGASKGLGSFFKPAISDNVAPQKSMNKISQLAFSLLDLFLLGEILPNFNSVSNKKEIGRYEIHDYSDKELFKSIEYFQFQLLEISNQHGGDENTLLTATRASLFKKYQDIIFNGDEGTTVVTAQNIRLVNVALLGDSIKGSKDGKTWIYFCFRILPPFKFAENFDKKAAKELIDEVLGNNHDLKLGVPELKGWFVNELEDAYVDQIASQKNNTSQPQLSTSSKKPQLQNKEERKQEEEIEDATTKPGTIQKDQLDPHVTDQINQLTNRQMIPSSQFDQSNEGSSNKIKNKTKSKETSANQSPQKSIVKSSISRQTRFQMKRSEDGLNIFVNDGADFKAPENHPLSQVIVSTTKKSQPSVKQSSIKDKSKISLSSKSDPFFIKRAPKSKNKEDDDNNSSDLTYVNPDEIKSGKGKKSRSRLSDSSFNKQKEPKQNQPIIINTTETLTDEQNDKNDSIVQSSQQIEEMEEVVQQEIVQEVDPQIQDDVTKYKAFRDSFLDVCLELPDNERIKKVRNYNGYDSDYTKGEMDRAVLQSMKDLERNMIYVEREKEIKNQTEKLVMIAEQRRDQLNQQKAEKKIPSQPKKKSLIIIGKRSPINKQKANEKKLQSKPKKREAKKNNKERAKKRMTTLHQKKGHKASNEIKVMNLNKSKTFSAVEDQCYKWLGADSNIFNEVKDRNMYMLITDVRKKAIELYNQEPEQSDSIIDTLDRYNKTFKTLEGISLNWKVVRWWPELSEMKTTIFLYVWFIDSNKIYAVDYLKIAKISINDFEMVVFTAFLQLNIRDVKFFQNKNVSKLRQRAKMAGHNPCMLTREQTQIRKDEQINNPSTFTTGFLYSDYHITEYDPEKVMNKNQFIAAQQVLFIETGYNDCMPLSVNQLLRYRFFTMREQVQKLWRESSKKSQEIIDSKKVDHGVAISAFRDFLIKDNQVISLVEIQTFQGNEAYCDIKKFVEDNLINTCNYREILVSCSQYFDYEIATHAGTFLRQEKANGKVSIMFYDPNENFMYEKGGHRIDYKKIFSRYEVVTICALKGRAVKNEAEREKIQNKMEKVMTGVVNTNYGKEKMRQGAFNSHEVRTNQGLMQGTIKKDI